MPADAKPIAFIQLDEKSKKLVVTEEAKKHLSAIKGTVGVCTVAGVYRTGKSYILNQIAGSRNGGFGIGSSFQVLLLYIAEVAPKSVVNRACAASSSRSSTSSSTSASSPATSSGTLSARCSASTSNRRGG